MNIQSELKSMHDYLMYKKIPYHSVSVVYRPQDMGFRVIFMESVREMITAEIEDHIQAMGFTVSYVA